MQHNVRKKVYLTHFKMADIQTYCVTLQTPAAEMNILTYKCTVCCKDHAVSP